MDVGLVADEVKGGDVFVFLQRPLDSGNDNATTVVAAHDIHRYSHNEIKEK